MLDLAAAESIWSLGMSKRLLASQSPPTDSGMSALLITGPVWVLRLTGAGDPVKVAVTAVQGGLAPSGLRGLT